MLSVVLLSLLLSTAAGDGPALGGDAAVILVAQVVAPMSDAEPLVEETPLEEPAPIKSKTSTAASRDSEIWLDRPTAWLGAILLVLLGIATGVGRVLRRQPENFINPAVVRMFNKRVVSYWLMFALLCAGILLGRVPTVLLFGVVSFWALREYITMTPTRLSDHRALFWTFFLLTPLQYLLVALQESRWVNERVNLYEIYSILIPVYASLFIPARAAFSGDHKRFLERTAKIQAGLMVCVYSLSYAPALLYLKLHPTDVDYPGYWGYGNNPGSLAGLLFYFVLIAQLGDVMAYAWGKLLGRHVIAPTINASKTWEGLIGGTLSTTLIGVLLWKVTPFNPWQSGCMAAVIALMGFAGGMTMSAIKRDRGVRDYGTLVTGHAGVLDRIDSLCFAAPVFFHLTRVLFGVAS